MIFEIEPTMRCSLHCTLCAHGANHKRVKEDEMTREDWQHNLAFFSSQDDMVITGGEPTLYKDLEYIIDTWVEKFNKPVLRITTNGYNWKRWLPLRDKIKFFIISYYPGRNDDDIIAMINSGIKPDKLVDMRERDFWDIWFAPKNLKASKNSLNNIKNICGLSKNRAVCKRYIWHCCVGGLFYRRFKDLPPYYGSIKIGSSNWRENISNLTCRHQICNYCFVLHATQLEVGELVPADKRELTGVKQERNHINDVFCKAFNAHRNGKLDEAIVGYQHVLSIKPDHPSALHLRGLIEFDNNNLHYAIPLIEKSLELSSNELPWILNYGTVVKKAFKSTKYRAKKITLEKIISIYRKALEIDPKCIDAIENLNKIYNTLGPRRSFEVPQVSLAKSFDIKAAID